jgi:hypothetical protein
MIEYTMSNNNKKKDKKYKKRKQKEETESSDSDDIDELKGYLDKHNNNNSKLPELSGLRQNTDNCYYYASNLNNFGKFIIAVEMMDTAMKMENTDIKYTQSSTQIQQKMLITPTIHMDKRILVETEEKPIHAISLMMQPIVDNSDSNSVPIFCKYL